MPAAKVKKPAENPMKALRARLSAAGVKRAFLDRVVLPAWWEDSLALSEGGFREAAGYVSAYLGFSLPSLVDASRELAFSDVGKVKYKKAKGVTEEDVCLVTHYALGVARAVSRGLADSPPASPVPAPDAWRKELLALSDKPWVCLRHIVDAAWKLGIPVIHLRNIPDGARKPDALTTMIDGRPVIVVMNARKSPSWLAFIIAHELGHIHLGHVKPGQTLVDEKITSEAEEKSEREANDYAVTLLTGQVDLGLQSSHRLNQHQLAFAARSYGEKYRVAPGVAALNYGFTTQNWAVASAAVAILEKADDAGLCLKAAMEAALDPRDFSEDAWEWITRATHAVE